MPGSVASATLKTALSLATVAEVYGKVGLVDKRTEVAPVKEVMK